MLRFLTLPLRRLFAAVSTAAVLAAPVSQLAHVEAMAQQASSCATMTMAPGDSPASPAHAPSHHHDASCCDFCGIGCCNAMAPLPTTVATFDPAPLREVATGVPSLRATIGPAPHVLPFALAPPGLTA